MSEQRGQATITVSAEASGADDSEPTPERQADLRKMYEANVAAGRPPYADVNVWSLGELRWIVAERGWGGEARHFSGDRKKRANLSGAVLFGVALRAIELNGANLTDAHLDRSDLQGAQLRGAILSGTHFDYANLSGADLTGARMDAFTDLRHTVMDNRTRLYGVVWNGVSLAAIDWSRVPKLGDEVAIRQGKTRRDVIEGLRYAARAYHGLAAALQEQGLHLIASRFRLREKVLERKAACGEGRLLGWIFSWLLYAVAGYGERPARILITYLIVVLGFAAAYLGVGGVLDPTHVLDAVVYSLTSFHGRGFFPGPTETPHDPPVVLAAIEAVVGLFVELTLIATFTQRFFAR